MTIHQELAGETETTSRSRGSTRLKLRDFNFTSLTDGIHALSVRLYDAVCGTSRLRTGSIRIRYAPMAIAAVATMVFAPSGRAQEPVAAARAYASAVVDANERAPRFLALSPDGRWLLIARRVGGVDEVAVHATSGVGTDTVPLFYDGCEGLAWRQLPSWNEEGDALAATCWGGGERRIYVWRRGAETMELVVRAPVASGLELLAWLSAGRMIYRTTERETPSAPPSTPSRADPIERRQGGDVPVSFSSAGLATAGPEDASCRSVGLASRTVAALCSDSVDVLRSRARDRARAVGSPGAAPVGAASSARAPVVEVTRVRVFDERTRSHTLAASIRARPGEVRSILLTRGGQRIVVMAEGTRPSASSGLRTGRPSRSLYVVSLAKAIADSALAPVLDLTAEATALDPRVARVLADVPVGELAIEPNARAVAYVSSQYTPWSAPSERAVADTVYLTSLQANAAPLAVGLDFTREADADTAKSLQWTSADPRLTWTPGGTHLLISSRGHLWRIDVETLRSERLSDTLGRSVTEVLQSSDREALVATYDIARGRSGLWRVSFAEKEWHAAYEEAHAMSRVVASGNGPARTTTVAYVGSTLRSPPKVHVLRLGRDGRRIGAPRALTRDSFGLRLPATRDTLVAYQVAPGEWGTAFLVRPAGSPLPVPTIVRAYPGSVPAFRGFGLRFGFSGAWGDAFAAVDRGYAVLLVDIPMTPNGEYGPDGPAAAIVQAVTAALDAAARTGWVDTTRVGVIGHSYGGYMVNVLVTRTQRFRAGVSSAGPTNWVSSWAGGLSHGPTWHMHHQGRMEESLAEAPERYVLNSPVAYLDNVTAALLLIHGVQDDIVHISQSEEMFRGLSQRGKIVELVRYHEAEHGCGRANCRFFQAREARALDWFDEHLRHRPSSE